MDLLRVPAATGLALAALLALSACGAGGTGAPAASPASPSAAESTGGGAVIDACALVPTAQLQAVVGTDPGRGVLSKGRIDGGRCTWQLSGTHTAIAQVTRQPDAYLPASVYPMPRSGAAVAGADRGWAAAATHTILIVKGGRGLLFTDVDLSRAKQSEYDALAAAIAAKL